jgi:copper chaperone
MTDERHVVLNVPAISCEHCKRAIESAVSGLQGIDEVEVEVPAKSVSIRFDAAEVSMQTIRDAIEEEGYAVAGEHEFTV